MLIIKGKTHFTKIFKFSPKFYKQIQSPSQENGMISPKTASIKLHHERLHRFYLSGYKLDKKKAKQSILCMTNILFSYIIKCQVDAETTIIYLTSLVWCSNWFVFELKYWNQTKFKIDARSHGENIQESLPPVTRKQQQQQQQTQTTSATTISSESNKNI